MVIIKDCGIFGCENETNTICNSCKNEFCADCTTHIIKYCENVDSGYYIKCPLCTAQLYLNRDFLRNTMTKAAINRLEISECCSDNKRILTYRQPVIMVPS